jgi:hypothetical protein
LDEGSRMVREPGKKEGAGKERKERADGMG